MHEEGRRKDEEGTRKKEQEKYQMNNENGRMDKEEGIRNNKNEQGGMMSARQCPQNTQNMNPKMIL